MIRRLMHDRAAHARFSKYFAVGGASAATQFLALWIIGDRWRGDVAFSVAYVVSVVTHYLLARFWALRSERRDTTQQLGEYLLVTLLSYAINMAAFKLGHDLLGLSVIWAALCAIPPSTVIVFLLLNYRVFRAKP